MSPNVMTVGYLMQYAPQSVLWLFWMMLVLSQLIKFTISGGSSSGAGDTVKSAPCRKRLNAAKHRTTKTVKRCCRRPGRFAHARTHIHTHLQAGLERSFGCSVVEPRGYLLLGELLQTAVLHEHSVDAAPGSCGRHVSVFLLDSLDHSCYRGTVPRRTRRVNATAEDRPLHQTPRMHV